MPFADLIALGRAAPALESLLLSQPRLPADSNAESWGAGAFGEYRMAPSCLRGSNGDVPGLNALLGGPSMPVGRARASSGHVTAPCPFPRLRVLVLDGQKCPDASEAMAALLRHMPALARFEMVFNNYVQYLRLLNMYEGGGDPEGETCGLVVDAHSAPIAAALRHPDCGGGRLSVFRSHDLVLGYIGDDPRDERCAPRWDRKQPEGAAATELFINCDNLPLRPLCKTELKQVKQQAGGRPKRTRAQPLAPSVRCRVCDELQAFFYAHYDEEAVRKAATG